jgi:hypothetical protein
MQRDPPAGARVTDVREPDKESASFPRAARVSACDPGGLLEATQQRHTWPFALRRPSWVIFAGGISALPQKQASSIVGIMRRHAVGVKARHVPPAGVPRRYRLVPPQGICRPCTWSGQQHLSPTKRSHSRARCHRAQSNIRSTNRCDPTTDGAFGDHRMSQTVT